ncbi:Peptide G protein-coupled receptor [Fasciola hepatica]|uniref:Peptide G protein-coupled receptor n=1 Tax=Fasciola hepatica TaxID=6192 RepID=A0A4E0S2A8_FASHE|nr:Peptide G protein-coupled receptor [Fasciola hepatica]
MNIFTQAQILADRITRNQGFQATRIQSVNVTADSSHQQNTEIWVSKISGSLEDTLRVQSNYTKAMNTTLLTSKWNETNTFNCYPNKYQTGVPGVLVTHVSLTLALLGIAVNVLTLVVLRRTPTRGATNLLLVALATEDIFIIIFYGLFYVTNHYYENYRITFLGLVRHIDSPLYFLLSWIKVAEIYTIVLLSLQRYLAIRWPLHAASLCSVGRTKRILVGVIVSAALLKLPNLILGYKILVPSTNCEGSELKDVFGDHPWYGTFQLIQVHALDQLSGFIIPLSILIVLNIGLIIRVRIATRKRIRDDQLGVQSVQKRGLSTWRIPRDSYTKEGPTKSHVTQDNLQTGANSSNMTKLRGSRKNWSTDHINSIRTTTQQSNRGGHEGYVVPMTAVSAANLQSRSVTLTLIGVVSTFIVFETPTTVCICYEIWQSIVKQNEMNSETLVETTDAIDSDFYRYAYPIALVSVMIGCASNFFVYMLVGRKFRRLCFRVLRECVLMCPCDRRRTGWDDKRPIRRKRLTRFPGTQCSMTTIEKLPSSTSPP